MLFFPPSVHFWCWTFSGFPTLLPVTEQKPQKCSKVKSVQGAAIPSHKNKHFFCQEVSTAHRHLQIHISAARQKAPLTQPVTCTNMSYPTLKNSDIKCTSIYLPDLMLASAFAELTIYWHLVFFLDIFGDSLNMLALKIVRVQAGNTQASHTLTVPQHLHEVSSISKLLLSLLSLNQEANKEPGNLTGTCSESFTTLLGIEYKRGSYECNFCPSGMKHVWGKTCQKM